MTIEKGNFVLTFQDEAQAWMEVSGTFYGTEWKPQAELALRFEGLNLDALYENLVWQIAGGRLDLGENIAEAARRDKQRQQLKREIAALEKKLLCEKQFNRQLEMNAQLKQLKQELEEILNE